jgi:tetratricopeptide (TPR) repeat protein
MKKVVAFTILFAAALPFHAHAHGELLVRIAALGHEIVTNATPHLYLQRGELYREDKNWEAAEADYTRASQLGVQTDIVDLCRAQLLSDRGQLDAAKAILDKMIQHSPDDGKTFIARARLLVRMNQRGLAAVDFERGVSLLTRIDSDVFLEWAQALAAEGGITRALNRLDEGITRFGPINALQVYAMDLELTQKNIPAALTRLQTIIEQADRKERWLAKHGDLELAAGHPLEARQSYEAALAAIRRLPVRLQRNPPMLNLESQINAAISGIVASPPIGKVEAN